MMRYIPDELFIDLKNKEKVKKILNDIPDTSLRIPGMKTIDDAIREIKEMGETKVANFLGHR